MKSCEANPDHKLEGKKNTKLKNPGGRRLEDGRWVAAAVLESKHGFGHTRRPHEANGERCERSKPGTGVPGVPGVCPARSEEEKSKGGEKEKSSTRTDSESHSRTGSLRRRHPSFLSAR